MRHRWRAMFISRSFTSLAFSIWEPTFM
jgi:hypothetical protein